jgi:ABC-2 type transport system ATP-binding protein
VRPGPAPRPQPEVDPGRGQHTIVLSTHILPEVQATCERIVIIHRGHIVAQDSLKNLASLQQGVRRVQLKVRRNNSELAERLKAISGIVKISAGPTSSDLVLETTESEEVVESVAGLVMKMGAGLLEISSVKADLEDIFLKLTYGANSDTVKEGEV